MIVASNPVRAGGIGLPLLAAALAAGPAAADAKAGSCLHLDPARGKNVQLTGKLAAAATAADPKAQVLKLSRPICVDDAPERSIFEVRVLPGRSATPRHLRNLTGFTTTLWGRLYPEPGAPQPAPLVLAVGRVIVP